MEHRRKLTVILRAITAEPLVSPGEVVVKTGLPRYEVLAAFHVLEALGVIEQVYSKGNHKLYTAKPIARKLLEVLEEGVGEPLVELAKRLEFASIPGSQQSVSAEVEA